MPDRIYRIGLIGSAGLGKSGVATEIGRKLDLPFLKSKDLTRPLLEAYGYDASKCACVEKFLANKDIEYEIVDKKIRHEQLMSNGFVTDRTTLECFAYALLSVEDYDSSEISTLEKICRENMANYTNVFYFPYKDGWLEDNGIRTMNTYFQWKVDAIIRALIDEWGVKAVDVPKDGRLEYMLKILE